MVERQARHQTKPLRDFVWWEDLNLGRDLLCNGRATDRQTKKTNPTVAVRIAEGGSQGGSGGAGAPPGKLSFRTFVPV